MKRLLTGQKSYILPENHRNRAFWHRPCKQQVNGSSPFASLLEDESLQALTRLWGFFFLWLQEFHFDLGGASLDLDVIHIGEQTLRSCQDLQSSNSGARWILGSNRFVLKPL